MSWNLYSLDIPKVDYMDISKNPFVGSVKNQPEIGDNLKINGKVYHVGILSYKGRCAAVHEIKFVDEDEVEETIEDEFTCPYCGYVYGDCFELPDSGEEECPRCGSEVEYERQVTVQYSVTPIRRAEIKEMEG